jgi:hypothetical protein
MRLLALPAASPLTGRAHLPPLSCVPTDRSRSQRILRSCLQFVAMLEVHPDDLARIQSSRVDELKTRFQKDAQFLFHILHTSNAQDLILRLNFNGHFSDT